MALQRFFLLSVFAIFVRGLACHGNSGENSYSLHTNNGGSNGFCPVSSTPVCSSGVFDVKDFGAKGDGATDDSEAFVKAWSKACSSSSPATLLVPKDWKYLLKPVMFSGPCKSHVTVMIKGTLEAPSSRSSWKRNSTKHIKYWIFFSEVGNLVVEGGGTLNGKGQVWWQNSCKRNKSQPCINAPTALSFSACNDLKVRNLRVRDSQQIHVWFRQCTNVQVHGLTIIAPESSPNTDGIHVSGCKNVLISNSVIGTGDDCVSIVSGSRRVIVQDMICGPGHGISIGSLGSNHSAARVSDVIVDRVRLKGTTNGARIKTWQGGSGYAKQIIFQNIAMQDVKNPIIIDQNYCDSRTPCHEQRSAVAISNVFYRNIKGTSASEYAIKFNCSSSTPCKGIVLQDINLVRERGKPAKSSCKHLQWTQIGTAIPTCASMD